MNLLADCHTLGELALSKKARPQQAAVAVLAFQTGELHEWGIVVTYLDYLIDQLLTRATQEISGKGFAGQIVTMALYFDHEGAALCVCADTLENALAVRAQTRLWSFQHFSEAINTGDLKKAALFNHNISRSLHLGSFKLRGLALHNLDTDSEAPEMPHSFFVALAQGLHRNASLCLTVCDPKEPVVFACSTAADEVGLVWTPPRD